MAGALVCVAVALLGIDVGWQPAPDGGLEYIIQIDPYMLDRLRAGQDFQSDIPADLKDVRSYRITVGTRRLPRTGMPAKPSEVPQAVAPPEKPARKAQETNPSRNTFPPPAKAGTPSAAPANGVPGPLSPAASKLLEAETAVFDEQIAAGGVGDVGRKKTDSQAPAGQADAESKVWIVGAIACGLLAAVIYLLWIHWGTRNRYRALVAQFSAMGVPEDGSRVP